MLLWVGAALAADRSVEVPFRPPAEVPLFVTAQLHEERGTAKGDDCDGAVQRALEQAAERGTLLRVVVSKDDLGVAAQAACKQRKAGDTISASVVDLTVLVIEPGSPASVYPPLSPERAVQVVALIGAVSGEGFGSATIDDLGGRAWVRLGEVGFDTPLDSSQLDANGRAVKAYEAFVPQWIGRWGSVLASVPEVAGAVLEVSVPSEDPSVGRKSRRDEVLRFAVPTSATGPFLRGEQSDEELLSATRVERAEDAKKRVFAAFAIDVLGGGLTGEGAHGKVDREGLDVRDQDLEGVPDE